MQELVSQEISRLVYFCSALKEETTNNDKGKREMRIDAGLIAQKLSYIALSKLEKKEAA